MPPISKRETIEKGSIEAKFVVEYSLMKKRCSIEWMKHPSHFKDKFVKAL